MIFFSFWIVLKLLTQYWNNTVFICSINRNQLISFRLCPHVICSCIGQFLRNFNFAIWQQRDKEIFFCKKNWQFKKMSSIPQQYFFNHRCQQCSHNLRLPDCFQKFYTIFFTKNLSGTWVLIYNSSDDKIAKEKFQRQQETKKSLIIYGKISKW